MDNPRQRLIVDTIDALAQLTKKPSHLRVIGRHYSVSRWAETHHASGPSPLSGWSDHLIRDQMHLARHTMADKETLLP